MSECPHCHKEIKIDYIVTVPSVDNAPVESRPKMGKCNRCGEGIYWHQSKKTGKWYSTNTEDYRDFHRQTCSGGQG